MPKLSKIRLTGCKYDGLRKEHENSIFDLTKGEAPDHSLFTLENNGGKGVMLQLIFQLLLPETKWGKNNGNQVISMFYDTKMNLHPNTFHVALEWLLDTIPEKRLITGIAVKSVIKNTGPEEEENTGLSYVLYTYEHNGNGHYTIENLPLYNNRKKEAIDLVDLEDFLRDNKRDIIRYSQSSGRRKDSDYYRYLQSRGIYRSEWLILKAINKSEGGISDYFSTASDNRAIFDKVIIPAIGENIRNYSGDEENSLIQMFKSNLSITKDLPILLKREGDYKELVQSIGPLIENADSGTRFIERRNRLIGEGNDLYYIINDQLMYINGEIEKWSTSYDDALKEKRELEYKRHNLEYNKSRNDFVQRQSQGEEFQNTIEEKDFLLAKKSDELKLYKINKVLWHKKEKEREIENKKAEREIALESLNLQDTRERAEELDNQLESEWRKVRSQWIQGEINYKGYLNYLGDLEDEEKNKKKKYLMRRDSLQNEINLFELKKDNLQKKKEKLGGKYDALSLSFPERILEDLQSSKGVVEKNISTSAEEIEKLEGQVVEIKGEIDKIEYVFGQKQKKAEELRNKIVKQEREELELAKDVSQILFRSYDGSILDGKWYDNSLSELQGLLGQKSKNLEEIQNAIWEKNIQISLNTEDYFVPNRDILELKREIQRLGIHVETGLEYLQGLGQEEADEILNTHLGFIFSLVMGSAKDWDILEKNLGEEIFLTNMVPIYIRGEMNKEPTGFYVVQGKAKDLVGKGKYEIWKESLKMEFESIVKTKDNILKDIESINTARESIILLRSKGIILDLGLELRELEGSILKYEEKAKELRGQLGFTIVRIQKEKTKLTHHHKDLRNLEGDIDALEDYIHDLKELDENQVKVNRVIQDLKGLIRDIEHMDETLDEIEYRVSRLRDEHYGLRNSMENLTRSLRAYVEDVDYKGEIQKDYKTSLSPKFDLNLDIISLILEERDAVSKDITSKNAKLAELKKDLEYLYKEVEALMAELNTLDESWKGFKYLDLPKIEIEIIINQIERDIKYETDQRNKTKSNLDVLLGEMKVIKKNLDTMERQILKEHKRAPRLLDIQDLDREINGVNIDLKSNDEIIRLCMSELEKKGKILNRLEINTSKLSHRPELDLSKGKIDKILRERLLENMDLIVDEWQQKLWNNQLEINKTFDEGGRIRAKFINQIEQRLGEEKLRDKIISTVKEVNIDNFKNNRDSFTSMREHFNKELIGLSKDKKKAEEAMKQWVSRASIYVIRMVETLKDMISSMNYVNENGYVFPLVKLRGMERLPKEEGEISYLLEEHFVDSINRVLGKDINLENLDNKLVEELMGDNTIFSKALQGRYPVLLVYKMTENNEFKYAKARDEHYATWEAINKGEGISTEGSGGQTLSITTFVTMMIMSFRKKHIGNENPSTVLILDNPFGKASGRHVLDPIFEIADKLNFQLICFAAPGIIKVEISERFPIFWELRIEEGKITHGGRIVKQ